MNNPTKIKGFSSSTFYAKKMVEKLTYRFLDPDIHFLKLWILTSDKDIGAPYKGV